MASSSGSSATTPAIACAPVLESTPGPVAEERGPVEVECSERLGVAAESGESRAELGHEGGCPPPPGEECLGVELGQGGRVGRAQRVLRGGGHLEAARAQLGADVVDRDTAPAPACRRAPRVSRPRRPGSGPTSSGWPPWPARGERGPVPASPVSSSTMHSNSHPTSAADAGGPGPLHHPSQLGPGRALAQGAANSASKSTASAANGYGRPERRDRQRPAGWLAPPVRQSAVGRPTTGWRR